MKTTPLLTGLCLLITAQLLTAGTIAYWRFEGTPNTQIDDGATAGNSYEPGTGVLDSSGNGNDLSVWDEGGAGYLYRSDVAGATVPQTGQTNSTGGQNSGGFPAMWCATTALQTWSPTAWTIEVAFQPEVGGYRTLVGRDSRGAATVNGDLAALYLQMIPGDAVAIKFCDVSGFWHEAVSAGGAITGFNFPNTAAGSWYSMAATSDGNTLSLYLKNVEAGNPAYTLVAQTDLTISGSPNRALTPGTGSGGDWTAGNWTVGRGLYAGGHGDRAWGFIDEVRISDTALLPSQLLFSVPEPAVGLLGSLGLLGLLRRRRTTP